MSSAEKGNGRLGRWRLRRERLRRRRCGLRPLQRVQTAYVRCVRSRLWQGAGRSMGKTKSRLSLDTWTVFGSYLGAAGVSPTPGPRRLVVNGRQFAAPC